MTLFEAKCSICGKNCDEKFYPIKAPFAWETDIRCPECHEKDLAKSRKRYVLFKTEASMWQMMADGKKPWDARRYDFSDDRIYRLSWSSWEENPPPGRLPTWTPDEPLVEFLNNETGEVLSFWFGGLEFVPWAPGWVFIILQGLVGRRDEDGNLVPLEGDSG